MLGQTADIACEYQTPPPGACLGAASNSSTATPLQRAPEGFEHGNLVYAGFRKEDLSCHDMPHIRTLYHPARR